MIGFEKHKEKMEHNFAVLGSAIWVHKTNFSALVFAPNSLVTTLHPVVYQSHFLLPEVKVLDDLNLRL